MEEIKDKVLQPENEIAHQLLQNISTDEVPTQITDNQAENSDKMLLLSVGVFSGPI